MTIVTSQKGTIFAAMVAPLFVLALPIIDTSLAILRRGMRGLPLFRPDRKHIHHRLLDLGHSSRTVVLGLYAFTAFFLLLGFASYCWQGRFFPLFFGVGVLTIILAAGKFDFSREWFSIGRLWGNSQETRSEIQYAMSLSRWLALEGTRVATIEELDEDVVFIARKLGFTKVKICLKAEEKVWALMPNDTERCHTYTHELPGHRQCFLELSIGCPESKKIPANNTCIKCRCATDIYADLLAEGWIKAVRDWQKCHRILASFDPPLKVPAAATATAAVSQKHKQP
jgi:UDP-GlcNAc:undecaprenyl-phosphate GlcNAc-1-phosphate transferase